MIFIRFSRYSSVYCDGSHLSARFSTSVTAKDLRKPEVQMAVTLVENLADKWDPSQYTDEYRENLMKIIKAKLKGKQPHLVEHVEPRNAEVVDLMERLRQSLQGAGGTKKKKTARAARTSPRSRKRAHAA